MKNKVKFMLENKHLTMPILSFPSTQLMGCNVMELLSSSEKQAKGMQKIMERCNLSASLNMMDLSVEAEAFGATIRFDNHEIPTVTKGVLDSLDEVESLAVPPIGTKRTGIYIDGITKAKALMPNKLIMCGVIGPYSLAGRLYDMTELMMACFDEPERVEILLQKTTAFITDYINAFKNAGADGVIIAEPAGGLLSPDLCEEFSSKYVKQIIEEVGSEEFVVVYHNCGNTIPLVESILDVKADVYHFGNAIDIYEMLKIIDGRAVVMGNINPVNFRTEKAESIYNDTYSLLEKCSKFENFVISSGCDIPADSKWDNIDAYFKAVADFYKMQQ